MFTQAKLTTTKTSNELLIEFLEKKGLKKEAESLRNGTTLLDLSHNQIGDEGARVLADALKTNSSITSLDLQNNKIGDAGARVLADTLKTNFSITSLNLSCNQIGNAGAKEIEERICYNKEKKLPLLLLLLCSYFKSNMDAGIEFKVLTANKFYKVVNKQLLKESLQKQGINDAESELEKVDDLIKMKPFTIAGVCKDAAGYRNCCR